MWRNGAVSARAAVWPLQHKLESRRHRGAGDKWLASPPAVTMATSFPAQGLADVFDWGGKKATKNKLDPRAVLEQWIT